MPKKAALSNSHYRSLYRAIKPFVSFKVDGRTNFTPAQKAKVARYYNELEAHLWTYNTAVKIPKNKKAAVLKNLDYKNKEYKAVPFRAPPDIIKRVEFGADGSIKSETKFGEYQFLSFDKHSLARDKDEYLEKFFAKFDEKTGFQIVVGDGRGVYGSFNSAKKAQEEILFLQARYSQGGEKFKRYKTKSGKWRTNAAKNWLSGVATIKYKKQSDLQSFSKTDFEGREKAKNVMREFNKKKADYEKQKNKAKRAERKGRKKR